MGERMWLLGECAKECLCGTMRKDVQDSGCVGDGVFFYLGGEGKIVDCK